MKDFGNKIVNAVLFPFGRCRIKLGEWPVDNAAKIIGLIKRNGGISDGEGGMPTCLDEYYFRMPGGRVKVSIFEYGAAYLWGPKRLVRELVAQMAMV